MALQAGQTLTHYEILGPLGAGGMGEVYRAKDTRLEREVAIKVLPEELADDEERLRRFEREAKTLASLNHTHVAGIHGVDQVPEVSPPVELMEVDVDSVMGRVVTDSNGVRVLVGHSESDPQERYAVVVTNFRTELDRLLR